MIGGRAASGTRTGHGRRVVVAGATVGLLASAVLPGAKPAAVAAARTPIAWIAAQRNPFDVGLDPVASQISRDGSIAGFVTTWDTIDPGDVHLDPDVFEYRVASGATQRINVTPGVITYGNGWLDSFSVDGSVLSFTTGGALLPDDTNDVGDVYVLDRSGNQLQRVSVDAAGQQSTAASGSSAVSADGRVVAFAGELSTTANPTDREIWLRDLATGQLEEISVATDGTAANDRSELGSMSDDGRYVSFWSRATSLGGGPSHPGLDYYIRDRVSRTTTHGIPYTGVPDAAVMSGDGNVVAYVLDAASDPSRPRLVHVWDRHTGIDRVLHIPSPFSPSYRDWGVPIALSSDGRFLVMEVPATPSDHLAIAVAVYDTVADSVAFPAVDGTGAYVTSDARAGSISADGTKVLFTSWADGLAAGDGNHDVDLFLRVLDAADFQPAPTGTGLLSGPIEAADRAVRSHR